MQLLQLFLLLAQLCSWLILRATNMLVIYAEKGVIPLGRKQTAGRHGVTGVSHSQYTGEENE